MISLFLFYSFTFFSVASVFDFRCTAGTFTRFKFDQNLFSCFAIPLQLSLVFFFLCWRPSSLLRWLHTWMTVIITFLFFFTPNICRQRRVSVQRSSLDKIWWPWSTGTYYPDLLDTADKTVFCRAACVDRLYSYLDRSYTVATLFGYYRKFDGADHDNQNDEYIKTPGSLSCVAVCSSQLAAAVCIFQYFVVFRKL